MVTSCNNTKNELVEEVNAFIQSLRANGTSTREEKDSYTSSNNWQSPTVEEGPVLEYIDHVRTYPTFRFGGSEGSQVCTVAFILRA